MKTMTSVGLALILVAAAAVMWADEPREASGIGKLVGTWKVVSAKYGGQDAQREEGITHIKHVTPTQFMWAIYDKDGKVSATLGGSYTVKGDEYSELPEYG